MSAAGRCAAQDEKEAASPLLAPREAAAPGLGGRAARGYGAAPRLIKPAAYRLRRRPCGPGLSTGALRPLGQEIRADAILPRPGAARPMTADYVNLGLGLA